MLAMFLLNLLLALAWVALTGQATPLNFIIGFGLGLALLALMQRAAGRPAYAARLGKTLLFLGYFGWQIVVANLRVTRDILLPRGRMQPAVVDVPLDLTDPAAITLLANVITLTPGTLSLDVAADRRTLYVHAMHVSSADEFRREIKDGFERIIKEMFQ
ncbi:MAG: Na+/H+ antiporter subunit E [Anaerolineae bacterium]